MASILIIDDDPSGSRGVSAMLAGEQHAVRRAESGAAGLAQATLAPPDLILLDIMMPGMDGFEVIEHLKKAPRTQAIPVIMLTALDERVAKLRALELGAEEFLTKPIDRADLLARVRNLLRLGEYRLLAERRAAHLAEANAELEAFASSVSHDLRRPLRAIEGFAAQLERIAGATLDAPSRENLQRIEHAAAEMNRLIDDLIQLARVTAKEMQERRVDLSALAHKVVVSLQRAAPQRNTRFAIQPEMVACGDPGLLLSVITNLLDNAWKFTRRRADATIEFGCRQADGETVYFVRDNGAGFDMRRVDMLFQAFRRLHAVSEYPGEGIGLAMVRRIISRHGGRVWAEGAPGLGATFYFTLP